MVLTRSNQRHFHRCLFSAQLETVTILKRDDDQRQGVVRSLIVYEAWRGPISKTKQTLQHDMIADHRTVWHMPKVEMERVGISYFNPLDRIVDSQGRYWHPESTTVIDIRLMEVHIDLACLRIDPPATS